MFIYFILHQICNFGLILIFQRYVSIYLVFLTNYIGLRVYFLYSNYCIQTKHTISVLLAQSLLQFTTEN